MGAGCTSVAPDRPGYGANAFPVWHPLTRYEDEALRARGPASKGDWKALLRLALVASGDPRDDDDVAALEKRVHDFLARYGATLRKLSDHRQRGRYLLELLHHDIFETAGGQLGRYRASQSQLTVTLDDGTYNCISSALLYLVTARAVGLDARGVKMPHHAFVEVRLPGGERVDVETTSPRGFGLRRDRQWFTSQSGRWSRDRGLQAVTWADYQRRQVISPLRMVADNMVNQHTHQSRMPAAEIRRLRELRGELLYDVEDAQFYRLHAIGFEHNEMHNAGEHHGIARMYGAVEPALAEITRRHGGRARIKNLLAWHRGHYASALQQIGKWPDAARWLDYTERLLPGIPDAARIEHNLLATAWREIQSRAKTGDIRTAQQIAHRWQHRCTSKPWCRQNMRWLAQFR